MGSKTQKKFNQYHDVKEVTQRERLPRRFAPMSMNFMVVIQNEGRRLEEIERR